MYISGLDSNYSWTQIQTILLISGRKFYNCKLSNNHPFIFTKYVFLSLKEWQQLDFNNKFFKNFKQNTSVKKEKINWQIVLCNNFIRHSCLKLIGSRAPRSQSFLKGLILSFSVDQNCCTISNIPYLQPWRC